MNSINITGRITADTELKTTANGTPVCNFTVAVVRPNVKDKTDFLDCVAWRGTAEFITRYFRKGNMIAITGVLTTRKYETQNGAKRVAYEILCDNVSFCEGRNTEAAPAQAAEAAPTITQPNFEEVASDEELPF